MLLYRIIDLCIINILNRNNDRETAAIATALRRYGRRVQFINHRVGGFAKLTPCILVAAFTLQDRARHEVGGFGQRHICVAIVAFNIARVGIFGIDPIGRIVRLKGAGAASFEGGGAAHIHRQLTDEFCATGNVKLHQRSGHFLEPSDDKVIALELLSVRGRDNDSVGLASEIRIRRDCHIRQFSSLNRSIATAYGLVGCGIHQLPFANIPTECEARFAAIALLQGNLGDRLLGERNLLIAWIHLHITIRHNKGCFLLGHICEGHAGGLRIPLGEHLAIAGAIIRLHGNGFPGDCRGGGCRAVGVRNRDAVRHGCGGRGRRFAHQQPDDMLVAHDADVAGALFQIQVQGKGIERRVCVLEKGIGVVFGAVENKVGGGRGSARNIALALGVVAVACVPQFVRQSLPRECEGMLRVVGNLLNFALEVLGVVDFFAVQRDIDNAPCIGDDSDGVGSTAIQQHFIIIQSSRGSLFQNNSVSIGTGKGVVRRNNCAVAKALIQSQRNIGVAFRFIVSIH